MDTVIDNYGEKEGRRKNKDMRQEKDKIIIFINIDHY